MQTETQRNFKQQMMELEQKGKIEKSTPKYTVRFSEPKTVGGILGVLIMVYAISTWIVPGGLFNLPKHMATNEVGNYIEAIKVIDQQELALMGRLIERAKLEQAFTAEELAAMQEELNALRDKLSDISGIPNAEALETQQLDQIQTVLANVGDMPLFSDQVIAVNTSVEKFNQLNSEAQSVLTAYLTDKGIKWEYNEDGGITYEYLK